MHYFWLLHVKTFKSYLTNKNQASTSYITWIVLSLKGQYFSFLISNTLTKNDSIKCYFSSYLRTVRKRVYFGGKVVIFICE